MIAMAYFAHRPSLLFIAAHAYRAGGRQLELTKQFASQPPSAH